MAEEPDWAKVLQVMYEEGMTGGTLDVETTVLPLGPEIEDPEENEFLKANREWKSHQIDQIREKVGKDESGVRELLDDMKRLGLVEEVAVAIEDKPVALTEKGFDVAHERELNRRREKTNSALVVFTFALVLVGVVGNSTSAFFRVAGNFSILVVLLALFWWTDVLELPRA